MSTYCEKAVTDRFGDFSALRDVVGESVKSVIAVGRHDAMAFTSQLITMERTPMTKNH